MLLYLLCTKVIFYCNFVTCNSLLPNTAIYNLVYYVATKVTYIGLLHGKIGFFWGDLRP